MPKKLPGLHWPDEDRAGLSVCGQPAARVRWAPDLFSTSRCCDPRPGVREEDRTSIRACTTIGKARRALLRGTVHVRHAAAEIDTPEIKAEVLRVLEEISSLRNRLSSLSTRVRRVVKSREGLDHG